MTRGLGLPDLMTIVVVAMTLWARHRRDPNARA